MALDPKQLGVHVPMALIAQATTMVERYEAQEGDGPSEALSNEPNPSLMLGTVVIGHHLLRLHAPSGWPGARPELRLRAALLRGLTPRAKLP